MGNANKWISPYRSYSRLGMGETSGVPLHLWYQDIFKQIGVKCGGWIETEEETTLRNHLKWARIKVKGPFEQIPKSIELEKNGVVYTNPVWCKAPASWNFTSKDEKPEGGFRESRLIAGSTGEGLVHKVQGTAGSDSNLKIREDIIMGPVIKGPAY